MVDSFNTDDRAGWELIWRSGDIPPRYRSFAAPNQTVVEWQEALPAGGFVLDVGCGVGRHCVYLGERGFRVAGVDVSPSGIQMARDVCAERQINFDGRVSDMTALPWPDRTFDGALSTSTIHHHLRANIVKTLDEVRRVLKPGGLFFADFLSTGTLQYQASRRQVEAGEITEVEPNTFVDERPGVEEYSDDFLPHHFCDEADLRDLLRSFDIIKLWADMGESNPHGGIRSRWVVWVRRPLSD
jgi:tellurite methyltransferase